MVIPRARSRLALPSTVRSSRPVVRRRLDVVYRLLLHPSEVSLTVIFSFRCTNSYIGTSPSIIRLNGYVRASLNIDVSRMVLTNTPTREGSTPGNRRGRRVVIVSEEPIEVEDSSPESRKSIS